MKLCFVSLYTYSLFNSETNYYFGGAEVRASLIGKGLAHQRNHQVVFVTFDHKQPSPEYFDNVLVVAHPGYKDAEQRVPAFIKHFIDITEIRGRVKRRPKFPFFKVDNMNLRILFIIGIYVFGRAMYYLQKDSLSLLLKSAFKPALAIQKRRISYDKFEIYKQIDAEVYCVFGVHELAAEVAAYCKYAGKKIILFIADDTDLSAYYQANSQKSNQYGVPGFLCHYAIKEADLIFVQTNYQAQLLKQRFERECTVVYNPIDLTRTVMPPEKPTIALWVGRADNFKKMPLILVELAKATPQIEFVMVMNRQIPDVEASVRELQPPNLTIYESVPFNEVEKLFAQAFVFINTSKSEGFPNTFLQAGKYGVPILSFEIDPDGFIEKYQCGIVAHGDFNRLVEGLTIILTDQQHQQHFSNNILTYVKTNHDLYEKVRQIDQTIINSFGNSRHEIKNGTSDLTQGIQN